MNPYGVIFAPQAQDHLTSLYEYIATHNSTLAAQRHTEAVVSYCESLARFPHRGHRRDDIRPGLRITNYRKRTVIAFEIDEDTRSVSILGVFYGGRDHEGALGTEGDDPEVHEP